MTTSYEEGFAKGEKDAWTGREHPLPDKPAYRSEFERGYWDARLPRTHAWAVRRRSVGARADDLPSTRLEVEHD